MSHTSHMSSLSHCISQIFKVSEKNNLPLLDLSASPQVKKVKMRLKKAEMEEYGVNFLLGNLKKEES